MVDGKNVRLLPSCLSGLRGRSRGGCADCERFENAGLGEVGSGGFAVTLLMIGGEGCSERSARLARSLRYE